MQNGVFKMPFEIQTVCHPDYFLAFKYQTSLGYSDTYCTCFVSRRSDYPEEALLDDVTGD